MLRVVLMLLAVSLMAAALVFYPDKVSSDHVGTDRRELAGFESVLVKRDLTIDRIFGPVVFPEPQSQEEFEADAEERREWFMRQRTYPFEKIPDDARRAAWLSRPAKRIVDSPSTTWVPIGPAPTASAFPNNWGMTSGRINAVAISPTDPQLALIGASTGGIWRSTNGGTSFTAVSDDQVDLAVGSIAFAPSNPSIVYAGMGDADGGYLGTGVLRSTNGGVSWTRVSNSSLPSPGRVTRIDVDPTNPNRVYLCQFAQLINGNVFASGFFYSTNGGVSWTKTASGLPSDLVRHPTQPNTLYMAMRRVDGVPDTTPGVLKSTDGGVMWNRIYSSPFGAGNNIKVAVTPAAPLNLYVLESDATGGRVNVNTNEGVGMWMPQAGTFDYAQSGYNFYLYVHPTNANILYVGTRDVWRSVDGGASFTNLTKNFTGSFTPQLSTTHPDQHHFCFSPSNPSVVFTANDGGLSKSTDGGDTFQSLNSSLSLTQFTSIALHPTDRSRSYGGTQDNGTERRTGGGNGWQEFISGDGGQTFVDPLDPSIVYTTYVTHTIFRFSNNGSTFSGVIGSPTTFANDRIDFYPPFVGNGIDSKLYFGTYRLWVSANRGASWSAPGGAQDLTNGGVLSAIAVSRSNTNFIYTGASDGRFMFSDNAGVNWNDRTAGLPTRVVTYITVDPSNPNIVYVTLSGFNSGHVFKSVNAGVMWTDISGNLPNIPTNAFLIDPRDPSTFYVGTDIGVFRSTAGGNTWEPFNTGMPPAVISEFDVQLSGKLQVATYGRGAYEIPRGTPLFDFDGDGKTDIGISRPLAAMEWWITRSSDGQTFAAQFGASTDRIAPADYTGDGKTDITFWRPSTGEWYVLRSEDFSFFALPFGTAGDIPAPADFDGDSRGDFAVFRPSTATWYIRRSSDGQATFVGFGANGDRPVPADYDADGRADVAIYRNNGGLAEWWINRSTGGLLATQFGVATDKAVPGDYTGDGKTDVALWRPSTGEWFVLRSEDFSYFAFPFGANGDVVAPGDYDGDGKFDAAVFRSGTWFIARSSGGTQIVSFGMTGDRPIPNAFVP